MNQQTIQHQFSQEERRKGGSANRKNPKNLILDDFERRKRKALFGMRASFKIFDSAAMMNKRWAPEDSIKKANLNNKMKE